MLTPPMKKAIGLLVLLSFISKEAVWADFSSFPSVLPAETQATLSVQLPADLGTVESLDYPEQNPEAPLIFQIKTLHGHYETAHKIKSIVRFLKEQYGTDLLFAEGGSGKLHPEYLKFVQGAERNTEAVDRLVQKGEATGVDLALLDGGLEAFGVEDAEAYKASFMGFKKVLGSLDKNEEVLEQRRMALEKTASKVLPPETRDLLEQWLNFNAGRRDFLATVKFLQAEAQTRLAVDFQTPFAQFGWPQLTRLVLITELEKKRSEEKLKSETLELETQFPANQPAKNFLAFIESKTLSQNTGAGEEIPRRIVEKFLVEAKSSGISLKDYPQTVYAAARKVMENELDSRILFEEMERLFEELLEKEMNTPEQREIVRNYQNLMLTRKLLRLEMSPRDWENWQGAKTSAIEPSLAESLETAEAFYQGMSRREEAFLDRMAEGLKKRRQKTAVLVTGGFHGAGMKERLRERGMGLVVITPHVSGDLGNDLYHKIMMRSAGLEQTVLANDPAASLAQGWDVAGQSSAIRQALREEGFEVDMKGPYFSAVQESLSKRSELRSLNSPFAEEDRGWDGIVRKYGINGKITGTRDAEGNPIGKFASTPSPYVDFVFAALGLPSKGPALVLDAGHGTGALLGRLASRALKLNPEIRFAGVEGSPDHFKASQAIHSQALKKNLIKPGQINLMRGNFNDRKDLFREASVVVYAEAGSGDLNAFAETLRELRPGARLVTIGEDASAPEKLRELLTSNGDFDVRANEGFPRITVYTRRSELRTGDTQNGYELVEKELDVRSLFPADQQDKPLNQIVFVSDNTGTMVQGYGDPLSGTILEDSIKLLGRDGFFLLVNSGDPLKDLAERTYTPLLDGISGSGREHFHIVADGGSRRIGFAADASVRYREELDSWPKARRFEYAKALAEAFYQELKKRQGFLAEALKDTPDSKIDAIRDERMAALEAIGPEAWGEKQADEAKYIFDLLPQDFLKGWGRVFVYDVGPKVSFDAPSLRDLLPAEFTPGIMTEVQKKYPPGTEDLYVVSVPGAVDMARVSKIEGVSKTLNEQIYRQLDPKQPLLMIVIGDGDNDIPTFSLKGPAGFSHAVVPVFLRSLPSYASRLPEGTFIANDKMAGTAQVLDHLAKHAGKMISEIPPLRLRQWVRSELRTGAAGVNQQASTAPSLTREDLLGLKFLDASRRAMGDRDQILVEVEGIPEGIYVHRNVFNPAIKNVSSPLLGQVLEINPGDRVLDIGSGTGYQGIIAVKKGAGHVLATDVSDEAVSNIEHNIQHLGLKGKLEARKSDLFEAVSPEEKFDLIIFSPPLLAGRPSSILERSIYDDQRDVLKRFFEEASRYLAPGGRIQMIFSQSDMEDLRELVDGAWSIEVLETKTYEGRNQGYNLLKLERISAAETTRSELRTENAEAIGLDGRLKGLDLYEKVFSQAPDTTLRVGRDIAHTGALQAAAIIKGIQGKRKAYDAAGQKDRDVFIIFATGNTQWLGLTTLASILDSWGSWDDETRQLLTANGVDLSDKPDMGRIFATHLDTIFPQSRDDYYSYANELHNMFDKLGISREKRRMFYGDVKNDLIEPGADNKMDKAEFEKVQASIDQEGLKLDEFLKGQLAQDHPQYAYLEAVNRYTKKMAEFVLAKGPDIALFSAGPSYEGKGHFAFNEAGTPFDQGLVMSLLSYHAAAGNIKDRGGMQHFRTPSGEIKIGGATLGPKEIRSSHPIFITIINGKEKRESVRSLVERTADIQYPMTALQIGAPGSVLIMESASGSTLRYFTNTWDFVEIPAREWNADLQAKLFVRLSKETGKPVSALTIDDWLQSPGKDQTEIAAIRTKNLIALTTLQPWEVLRDEVVKTLNKDPLKSEQVPARLGLRPGDEIVHIGPHLDDLSLAAQFLVSEFSKQGHRLYSYYTAPGYTAVSDEYVLSALGTLKNFRVDELAALAEETRSVFAFKQSEEKYLRQLIKVLAARDLAYDPMDYDTWSQMPAEEQKLRAKLLFLRLNFESSLKGQLSSPERISALRDALEIYIQAKPHWGSSEIVVMQKLKVALRFVEEQTELMSRGVGYDDIFFPFQSSWYALERKGTARQSDIDVIKDVIRSKKPRMVIVNGEGFMDHGAHSITEMTVKVAVKELYEEGALPDGFRMFFYRGVWDRAEITGRPDQILVALGEEELEENKSSFVRNYPSQAPALVPDASVKEPMFFSDQVVTNARETLAEWAGLNGRKTDDPALQGILAFDMIDFKSRTAVESFLAEVVAKKTELDRVQIPINRASLSKIIGSAPPYADLSGQPGEKFLSVLAAAGFPFETVLTKEEIEKTKVEVRSELRSDENEWKAGDQVRDTQFLDTVYTIESIDSSAGKVRFTSGLEVSERQLGMRFVRVSPAALSLLPPAEQEFRDKAAAAGLHAGDRYGLGPAVYTLLEAVNHPQYGWAFLFRVEKSGQATEQGYLIPDYFQQFKLAARLIVDAEFTVQQEPAPEAEVYAPVVSKPADQGLIKKHLEGERAADLTADEELWNLLPEEVREKIERVIAEYRDQWKAGDIEREDGFSDEKRAVKIAWKGTIRGEEIDGIIVSGVLFNRDNIGEDFRGLNWGSSSAGTEDLDEETIRESAISVHVAADGRPDLRPAAFAQKGGHGGKTAAKKFANARTVLPQKGLRTPVAVGFALYTPDHIKKDGEPLGAFISAHRQSEKRFKTYQEKAVNGLLRGYANAMADVKRRALTTFQITYFDPAQVIPELLKENNIDQLSEVYGRELRKVVDAGLYPHSPHFANFEADPSGRLPTTWHDLGGWEIREDLTPEQAFGYAYMTLTYAMLNLKIRFGNRLEEFYKAGYINPYQAFFKGFFHDQLENPDFNLNDFKLDHDGRSSLEYAAYDVVYRDAPQTLSPLYKRLDQPFVKVLRTVMGMPVTSEERSSFKPDSGSRMTRPRPISSNVLDEEWEDGEGVAVHQMYERARQSVGMDALGPQFVQEYIVPELKALVAPEDIEGVVEYGAGAGTLWDWAHDGFADWYPGNPRYPSWIQTDMNMDALRYSRGRVKKVIPVDLRHEPIPFKDKAAAVSWAGLDTLPVPELPAVIRDIAATLKPGGKLIVGLDMGSSITTEVYEAQRNGWVAFPYFTEIAPGEWRPTGMMTIDWNLMKRKFQPKAGETAVWGMIRQYMTVYTARPSSPEAAVSQALQSEGGTANLKVISQWLAEKSRETQTLKHVAVSRPALHLERVKRAAEAAGFSIQSAGEISKTYLIDRSAIPGLHPAVNHILYSEGMVVQQVTRGIEKGKVRVDAKFHLLTAVKTGEPKETLAYTPLGIAALNGGRLEGSRPLVYQMAKLLSSPVTVAGKEEVRISEAKAIEIIEGVIREALKSDKVTKPRKRFDEAAAVKAIAKDLAGIFGKLNEREVNNAFIKARLGFTQAGYGASIAGRLNEALGRSELRAEDAELWSALIEIAEGRTPRAEELEKLETLLDQDPAQSVTAQYFGTDKQKIVADRIEVLRKVWPSFREFWKTQVLREDVAIDSLWRVYLPLAQWVLAEKRSRRPDELFVLGIGGAIGSGKTTLSRVMALLLNEMLDDSEGQAVARSLDDYYLPKDVREKLREKGYAPGMKVNRALPGTQDVAWIERNIREMEQSGPDTVVELPRFSKLKDDHETPDTIKGKIGVFVFEGWLNGANTDIDVSQVEPGLKRVVAEELQKYKPVFDRFDGFFAFPRPTVERMIAGRIQQDEHQARTSGRREFTDEQIGALIRYWEVDHWQPPVTSPSPKNETTTLWIEAEESRNITTVRAGGKWNPRSELRNLEEKKQGWLREELGLSEEVVMALASGDSVRWRMRDLHALLSKRYLGKLSTLTAAGGSASFAYALGIAEPYKKEIERIYDQFLGYAEKTSEALGLTDFRMLNAVYEKLSAYNGQPVVKLSERPVLQRTFLRELPARVAAFDTSRIPQTIEGKEHLAVFLKDTAVKADDEAVRQNLLAWLRLPDSKGLTWNLPVFRSQFLELFPEFDAPRMDHGFLLWTLDLAAEFAQEDDARGSRFGGVDTSVGQSFGFTREKSTRKMRALRESLAELAITKQRFENPEVIPAPEDDAYQPAALGQIQDLRKIRVLEALSSETGRRIEAADVLDELGSLELRWSIPEFYRKHSSIVWLKTRGYHTFFYAARMEIPMRRILRERYDRYAGNMKLVAESFGMDPKAMRDFYSAMGMDPSLLYVRPGHFLQLLGQEKQAYLDRIQKQGWQVLASLKEEVLTQANAKLSSSGNPQLTLKNISHADVVWGLDLTDEFLKELKRLRKSESMTMLQASRAFGFTGDKSLSLTLLKRVEEGILAHLKEEKELSGYVFEVEDLRMRLRKAYEKDLSATVRIKRSSDGVWETLRSGYYFESHGGESAFVSTTVSSVLGKVKGPYRITLQGTFFLVEQAVRPAAIEESAEPDTRSELRTSSLGFDKDEEVLKAQAGLEILESLIEKGQGASRLSDFRALHALLEPVRVKLLKTRRNFSEKDIENEVVQFGTRNAFLKSYGFPDAQAQVFIDGLRAIARLSRIDRKLAVSYAEKWFEAIHIQVLRTEEPRQILIQIFGEWPVWADSVEKAADGLTRGGSLPEVQGGFRDHDWRSAGVRAEAGKVVIEKAGRTVFSAAFDELYSSAETRRNFRHALRVLLESKRYDYQRSELRAEAIQPASPVFAAQFRNYSLPAEVREQQNQQPEKPVTVLTPDAGFSADSREAALYLALPDVLANHAVLGLADFDSQDGMLLTKPSDLKDTAILKSWFLVPRSIDETLKTQLFQQLKPGGILIMAFEEGIVPDPAQFGDQAKAVLPPEIANAVYGTVKTQVKRRDDVIPYVMIQKARSELRSESAAAEESAAKLLFRHLAAESKDIPADHALVVLGNPYEGYAEAVVKKARELNSPEIVIVGKGGAAEPERVRLRREILALDPALASKIKGFDSVDESMHTGMNVTSLAQAVKDGAVQSQNFVLTQIPTGGLLSLRIFQHQWKQNAETMGLSLKTPGFYFTPVEYPFDVEAPLTDSKEERFYLEHAVGQIDRLKTWPLNPNPPLVLKEGDLTPEILTAAETVRAFLTRSELRDFAPGSLDIPAVRLPFIAAPTGRDAYDTALMLGGIADPSWDSAVLNDYRLALRGAVETYYRNEGGEGFQNQVENIQALLRDSKQVIALFAHIRDASKREALEQIFDTARFLIGTNQAKAHYVVLTVDRDEDAEPLREKLLEFLKTEYPGDAAVRNQIYSRMPIVTASNRLTGSLIPKGALSAWVDWTADGDSEGVIPEPARETRIQADRLPGGALLKFDEKNRGYGVSLLQAAVLLLQGAEESRLQQLKSGLFVQASSSAFANLGQIFKALRSISASA